MSDSTDIRQQIAAERGDLGAVLAGLSAAQWDTPSLCAGWRVREVVAHMTMPFRMSGEQFASEMGRAGGDFNLMADRVARRDAASMTPAELAAAVAGNAWHPWEPPGGGYQGALTHDVIHGLDVTVPLGVGSQVPGDRLLMVLRGLGSPQGLRLFGTDLDGVQLRADDLDWSAGAGATLSGSAQDLALVICGRRLPAGHLRGEHSERFTQARAT